jgi:hypothetical protein
MHYNSSNFIKAITAIVRNQCVLLYSGPCRAYFSRNTCNDYVMIQNELTATKRYRLVAVTFRRMSFSMAPSHSISLKKRGSGMTRFIPSSTFELTCMMYRMGSKLLFKRSRHHPRNFDTFFLDLGPPGAFLLAYRQIAGVDGTVSCTSEGEIRRGIGRIRR